MSMDFHWTRSHMDTKGRDTEGWDKKNEVFEALGMKLRQGYQWSISVDWLQLRKSSVTSESIILAANICPSRSISVHCLLNLHVPDRAVVLICKNIAPVDSLSLDSVISCWICFDRHISVWFVLTEYCPHVSVAASMLSTSRWNWVQAVSSVRVNIPPSLSARLSLSPLPSCQSH